MHVIAAARVLVLSAFLAPGSGKVAAPSSSPSPADGPALGPDHLPSRQMLQDLERTLGRSSQP